MPLPEGITGISHSSGLAVEELSVLGMSARRFKSTDKGSITVEYDRSRLSAEEALRRVVEWLSAK